MTIHNIRVEERANCCTTKHLFKAILERRNIQKDARKTSGIPTNKSTSRQGCALWLNGNIKPARQTITFNEWRSVAHALLLTVAISDAFKAIKRNTVAVSAAFE